MSNEEKYHISCYVTKEQYDKLGNGNKSEAVRNLIDNLNTDNVVILVNNLMNRTPKREHYFFMDNFPVEYKTITGQDPEEMHYSWQEIKKHCLDPNLPIGGRLFKSYIWATRYVDLCNRNNHYPKIYTDGELLYIWHGNIKIEQVRRDGRLPDLWEYEEEDDPDLSIENEE